jgi:DNA-binding response OmpR family regulator
VPEPTAAARPATSGAATLLLVEDDGSLAGLVARHLEAHGFPTTIAESAEDGERLLAEGLRPALVLLDINLPGDTGWSLLRSGEYEDAGSPPVVVVSATRIPSAKLRAFDIHGYLPKPFSMDTLIETVRRHTSDEPGDGLDTLDIRADGVAR